MTQDGSSPELCLNGIAWQVRSSGQLAAPGIVEGQLASYSVGSCLSRDHEIQDPTILEQIRR